MRVAIMETFLGSLYELIITTHWTEGVIDHGSVHVYTDGGHVVEDSEQCSAKPQSSGDAQPVNGSPGPKGRQRASVSTNGFSTSGIQLEP